MCLFGRVEMCSLGDGDVPFWGVEMCQFWGVEMCWDEVIHNRQKYGHRKEKCSLTKIFEYLN